jgi:DNA mismatch endonuclease (patch repair protein)
MADIVTAERRSQMMAAIGARDTKPEMWVRRVLHSAGLRYRLHRKDLPGRPDVVLPRWNAVIFVHGCFWHLHRCPAGRIPGSRESFWKPKLSRNRDRDREVKTALESLGWRVLTVWECSMNTAEERSRLASQIIGFVRDKGHSSTEIPSNSDYRPPTKGMTWHPSDPSR